jgi:tetratricopeptide (TPR) repeat protein
MKPAQKLFASLLSCLVIIGLCHSPGFSQQKPVRGLTEEAVFQHVHGNTQKAEELAKQALKETSEKGTNTRDYAEALGTLGSIYRSQYRFLEAERVILKSVAIEEKLYGKYSLEVALNLINLAYCYQGQKRYPEAEKALKQSISILDNPLYNNTGYLGQALASFGRLYSLQEHYTKAEPLLFRAVELIKREFGPLSYFNGSVQIDYGIALREQKKYEEAEVQFRQAIKIFEQIDAKEHPELVSVLHHMGILYKVQGRFDEAQALYARATQVAEKQQTEKDNYLNVFLDQGELYLAMKRPDLAEPVFRKIIAFQEKDTKAYRHGLAFSRGALARALHDQKRYSEAEAFYQKALPVLRKKYGNTHPIVVELRQALETPAELKSKTAY